MIFVVTKDAFLFQGITQLLNDEPFTYLSAVSELGHHTLDASSRVIIDVFHNNVINDDSLQVLTSLQVSSIIILAPFHISKIKSVSPLYFVSRKIPINRWQALLTNRFAAYQKPRIGFSHNQFKIVSHLLHQQDPNEITSALNISRQTLRSQKFNIMLKLRLRRMSDIVTLNISPYF
ncbi:LuxR family transcriptional regulator [Enterobacteriaceae bacterium 89]|nr:LuxR family transcriptional regulator [Enterobacteriaceae bacterium 89]